MKRHRALWCKRGLNDSCSIFLVFWCFANVQTQVLLGQLTALQQPFFLWFLVVTVSTVVGRDETSEGVGRSEGTARSKCKVTTCIRFLGQLDYDIGNPAVNLIPFPSVLTRRDRQQFTATSRPPRQCCGERITPLIWRKRARFRFCHFRQTHPSIFIRTCGPPKRRVFHGSPRTKSREFLVDSQNKHPNE